jgi:hypothetical protein
VSLTVPSLSEPTNLDLSLDSRLCLLIFKLFYPSATTCQTRG